MHEIIISLTEAAKVYVDAEIAAGRHRSASELFCHLVDTARDRRSKEVESKLQAALGSGPSEVVTPAFWETMRERIHANAQACGEPS